MWYSVDRESLRFLHKHKQLNVVQLLVWLEAPHCACVITSFGSKGALSNFTMMELQKLYLNTTGKKWIGFQEEKLRQDIAALACALEPIDCDETELMRQVKAVPSKDTTAYRYVRGANRAAVLDEGQGGLFLNDYGASAAFAYSGDPLAVSDSAARQDNASTSTQRVRASTNTARRATVLQTIAPTEGVAAEIWAALDADEKLRDPVTIQVEAKNRGWQTLTAILQLSQWRKFHRM